MNSLINSVHKRLIEGIEKISSHRPHSSLIVGGLGVVGAFSVASASAKACDFVWNHFLRPKPALGLRYGKSWAVITGASAGIGFEIAKLLAKEGINVALLARHQDRLSEAAECLKKINPTVEVITIVCDASAPDWQVISNAVKSLDISLLVNNVGVHNDIPTNTEDQEAAETNRIIAVNCNFQVNLTALLIPHLKKHQQAAGKKTSTTIINVSSLTSQMVMPMLSVYAATKAFEEHWSACLFGELQPDNIEVMCVRPGITVSRMSGISDASFFCPSSADMASAILHKIGCGKLSIAPYWPHALLDWINQLVPAVFAAGIVRKMHQEKRDELMKLK